MKISVSNLAIFICSSVSLYISAKVFYNLGIFVDEYNLSPSDVLGGDFWLAMNWLRLLLLAVACIVSFIKIFHRKNNA